MPDFSLKLLGVAADDPSRPIARALSILRARCKNRFSPQEFQSTHLDNRA
jgi:hypothetical protein